MSVPTAQKAQQLSKKNQAKMEARLITNNDHQCKTNILIAISEGKTKTHCEIISREYQNLLHQKGYQISVSVYESECIYTVHWSK